MPDRAARLDDVAAEQAARPRLGPRPLALHKAKAELAWSSEAPTRLVDFYRGIQAYRDHPYRRSARQRQPVWRAGGAGLIDDGPEEGWPVLVIPSLVNRAYILDLVPEASFLSFLKKGSVRPFLLDWGDPDSADRKLTLEGLILQRLEPAFDWVAETSGRKPLIIGYCMGGTLATALACRRQADCTGLALLATPWDFQVDQPYARHLAQSGQVFASTAGLVGSMSVDLLQALFALLDPMAVPRKFADFARLDPASDAACRFVAIEDWLNDGVPLGADLAAQCLMDWYGRNTPAGGTWRVGGEVVRPEKLDLPVLLAIPSHDRIVPAASTHALADALPRASIIRPRSGHIGMVAGRRAEAQLWAPLLAWLREHAALQK